MKRRILFVDDEPNVLQGLQRMLRSMRHGWEMAFAESGLVALDLLASAPFDVIVSDMRMPGMDGAQLLSEVMRRHPQIVRIVLSGQSDQETLLRAVGPAHQYLAKPCEAERLKATVSRACALHDRLADESLKRLVSQMKSLPSLPSLYVQMMEVLGAPDASLQQVGQIISQDMGMTAKILQLVNSAFFGLHRRISNPIQAVNLFSLDIVKALVRSPHVFSQCDETALPDFSLDRLWRHSLATGACAKRIAEAEHSTQAVIDESLTAGLLHDIGKLVLAVNLPGRYREVVLLAHNERLTLWAAERELFGDTHAEAGALLLGLWDLPDSIVEVLTFHHWPTQCLDMRFSPLTAVHVANTLDHEVHPPNSGTIASHIDTDYLAELGLIDRLPAWRALCQANSQGEEHR